MNSIRILLITSLFTAGIANAEIYRWVDENGRTTYSQIRPADQESERIRPSGARAPSNEEAWQEVERIQKGLDESREKRKQAQETTRKQKEEAALKRRNCETARLNLERYQGDPGRLLRQPDGSYVRLTQEERETRIAETREQIEQYCP